MKKNKRSHGNLRIRNLKGTDMILNLKEITVFSCDSFSSSTCSGPANFYFKNQTKYGYMEDPDIAGKITIIDNKKVKGGYWLKVKFRPENSKYLR